MPERTVYDVQGESWDLDDKMALITRLTREQGGVRLADLFLRCRARGEMVVTFIALLELIKLGQVLAVQDEAFADVSIIARPPDWSPPDATAEPAVGA
jgi:segregation and condensation protein A